jgi:hypothetical protein
MLKTRMAAGQAVAKCLFAAERAVDLAYTRIAELNAAIPTARLDANLSAIIGQDAIESSAEAMMLAARMRQLVVQAHERLSTAGGHMGLGAVAWGDEYKQPSATTEGDGEMTLRIAA